MSWLEEALADLQGVTRYTKDELEEMGYVHKEFSDELSPEFQEAVEESTKKGPRIQCVLARDRI